MLTDDLIFPYCFFFLIKDVKGQSKESDTTKYRSSISVTACAGNKQRDLAVRAGCRVTN